MVAARVDCHHGSHKVVSNFSECGYNSRITYSEFYTSMRSVKLVVDRHSVLNFAKACGDMNPLHLDDEAGKRSKFGRCIAHGMLPSLTIDQLILEIVGKPVSLLERQVKFHRPIFIPDEILVKVSKEDEVFKAWVLRSEEQLLSSWVSRVSF